MRGWSFDQDVSKDRAVVASAGSARTVARVGSSVILSGPMPAGEAVNCVAVGEDPPTTPDLPVRGMAAGLAALARRGRPMSSRFLRAIWLTPKSRSAGTRQRWPWLL
jgi:hypothetical protein